MINCDQFHSFVGYKWIKPTTIGRKPGKPASLILPAFVGGGRRSIKPLISFNTCSSQLRDLMIVTTLTCNILNLRDSSHV